MVEILVAMICGACIGVVVTSMLAANRDEDNEPDIRPPRLPR